MKDCSRAPRHAVWLIDNYIVKSTEDGGKTKKVECKACTRISIHKLYSGIATNMETHLKTRHPQLYKAMLDKQLEIKNKGKRIVAQNNCNNTSSLSMTNSQEPPPNPPELIRLLDVNPNQGQQWNHGNNYEQSQSTSGK